MATKNKTKAGNLKLEEMKLMQKIMVGLDLTETDETLIEYTKYLNLVLRPNEIAFVHVQKHLNVPEEIKKAFPALDEPVDESFVKEMIHETEGFNIVGTEIKYEVFDGSPLEALLRKSIQNAVDLIVVGRKKNMGFSGLVPQKLIRRSSSHVLLVPENTTPKIKKILVAVDFSDYSKMAIDAAIHIAEHANAEVICQHLYEVPIGYHKTGKSYQEFADIMKNNAKDRYDAFIKNIYVDGINPKPVFTLNNHNKLSSKIMEAAKDQSADLIIIGGRGRTDAAALLLGSVTEELITADTDIPMLVMKKKDKKFGLWDAFENL